MKNTSKNKSFWSTFKNAYLRSTNLKRFWHKLDKTNLSKELTEITNLYLKSESYSWTSRFWRHWAINHLNLIASDKNKNYENLISQEYFTFTYFNDLLIKDAVRNVQESKIDLNVDLFKKQNGFSITESINHNLILLLLYENIKFKKVFKYFNKLKKSETNNTKTTPSLKIDNQEINQDDLNSLFEYEQIEKLLNKLTITNGKFIEVGAGAGRTAKSILSIKDDVKYVIADIPPSIKICLDNLRTSFPGKKIGKAFELNDQKDLNAAIEKNDILFIFPHQIELFQKKTFDIAIAIDCLHEMKKKTIKNYMTAFENVAHLLYFKVWESAELPYSFYQNYSVHKQEDYSIKDYWKEHLKERCLYPSNYFHLGYEF